MSEEIKLPTKEDMAQLPIWAIVAFAARCARRVQPIFTTWPKALRMSIDAINNAISIAEMISEWKYKNRIEKVTDVNVATYTAEAYAYTAMAAEAAEIPAPEVGAYAAADDAAYAAAEAAKATIGVAESAVNNNAHSTALVAAYATAEAAKAAPKHLQTTIRKEIIRDFKSLLKKSLRLEYQKDPLPQPYTKIFGPMWPDGEPEGWPKSEATETDLKTEFYEQPPLEIYIDPGNASKKTIKAVFEAINDWHIAAGGLGLEFINDGNFTYASDKVLV